MLTVKAAKKIVFRGEAALILTKVYHKFPQRKAKSPVCIQTHMISLVAPALDAWIRSV